MPTIKWVGFRLLVNLTLRLFRRKPIRTRFEIEWKALPYEWNTDYLTESGREATFRTGTRVKSRSFV